MRQNWVSIFLIFGLILALGAGFIFNYVVKEKLPAKKDVQELGIAKEAVSPTQESTPEAKITLPKEKILPPVPHVYQTFNNCGPATLSMILGVFGQKTSQKELGDLMRPYQNPKGDNDDKTIFPEEFAQYAQAQGLAVKTGPAGDIELLKEVVAQAEIPVVVKGWLKKNEDIGHFWIVRGYNEENKVLITDDSFHGPGRKTSYADFLPLWQPFNYGYIIVYPKDKEEVVTAILDKRGSKEDQYQKAAERAQKEIELAPDNVYPYFNLASSYYYLGEYQKSAEAFGKVENRLPKRMLWYQIEPVLAYQKLGNFDRVFQITDRTLNGGNRAYSEFYQIRGEVFLAQNNKDQARAEFEKALIYNQNFAPAKESLTKI